MVSALVASSSTPTFSAPTTAADFEAPVWPKPVSGFTDWVTLFRGCLLIELWLTLFPAPVVLAACIARDWLILELVLVLRALDEVTAEGI